MAVMGENVTARDLLDGDVACPVCFEIDMYHVTLLQCGTYESYDGVMKQAEGTKTIGLLGLTCSSCDFELIKRTPREALWVERK
jgi:hypothetical protein